MLPHFRAEMLDGGVFRYSVQEQLGARSQLLKVRKVNRTSVGARGRPPDCEECLMFGVTPI